MITLWKFNIAPENGWLEDEFPFGIPYFQGDMLNFGGVIGGLGPGGDLGFEDFEGSPLSNNPFHKDPKNPHHQLTIG